MNNTTQKTKATKKPVVEYENNPFFVATNGLDLLFKKALPIGIMFGILSLIGAVRGVPSGVAGGTEDQAEQDTANAEALGNVPVEVLVGVGLLVLLLAVVATLVSFVFRALQDYTSAELAKGNSVSLGDAFRGVFKSFWGYVWVQIIVSVKVFLWSLLFIIPGIVMAIRYSLSGVAYFDKQLKGNAAVKDSLALTKDVWLTTMASHSLLNIVTLGLISGVLAPGTNAVLYRQYDGLQTKPKAHVLSWLTLALLIFAVSVLFGLLVWGLSMLPSLANQTV